MSTPLPADRSLTGPRPSATTRVLEVGVGALVIGGLVFFASRSVGGGLAGVLLSGLVSWLAFELGISIVTGLGPVPTQVKPRYRFLTGCVTLIAGGLGVGLILLSGQLLTGVILGGVAALVTHRTRLPTLGQMGGLDLMPDATGRQGLPGPPRALVSVVAVLCLLAGTLLTGLGAARVLEGFTSLTDGACQHPCGMVQGLWVQVLPDSTGNFVTRLDANAVQVRLRFRDDVAADRTASRSSFTMTHRAAVYQPLTNRHGCDDWAPKVLHFGESTGALSACFATPQSQEPDLSALVLNWGSPIPDLFAPIQLGKEARFTWGIFFTTG